MVVQPGLCGSLVGNPKDRFSHGVAQLVVYIVDTKIKMIQTLYRHRKNRSILDVSGGSKLVFTLRYSKRISPSYATKYTPQNNLRTSTYVFPLFNTERLIFIN